MKPGTETSLRWGGQKLYRLEDGSLVTAAGLVPPTGHAVEDWAGVASPARFDEIHDFINPHNEGARLRPVDYPRRYAAVLEAQREIERRERRYRLIGWLAGSAVGIATVAYLWQT